MYQKLLLNCDGGIIDDSQKSEQDNCAVVCIGLGGTGVDCLKNLKAKIYNRVKPDNPNSAVPVYSHIKFLAVDTDKSGMQRANEESSDINKIDLDTEFFDLSYSGDISDMFKENGATLDTKPEYKEWLRHKDIKVLSAKAGAGGVRQLGRYLLMERANDFVSKVNTLITQAMTGLQSPKTYVHIFSGLSGGTGAGTFLDICYLVQEAISRNRTNSFICGYFFLPDVNIAAGLDRETEAYVKDNGYAALQDLDYCMNFETNGDHWEQSYSGIGKIISEKPPVDICHLISARDASGNVIRNAYKYAMNVVTDYFMDFITKTQNNFTMESHISNYTNKKAKVYKEHGSNYEYCVLGAAAATLPFKEVLTYLAARMFEQIGTVKNHVPSKPQLDDFINRNGLRYDAIFAQMMAGADMTFPIPDVKWKDAVGNDELTVTYYKNYEARVEGAVEANYQALIRDLDPDFNVTPDANNNTRSIVAKVFNALVAISADPNMGPFYASAVLRSTTGVDLIAAIDGYLAEVRSRMSQENVQENNLRPFWEKAQTDFFGRPNKGRYETYTNATRNLVIHYTRMTCYSKMEDLLMRVRKQFTDLANDFMDVFRNTIDNLIDTFRENRVFLDSQVYDHVNTEYEYPLAQISDLKESLDMTIREMDMGAKTTDFMKMMLDKDGIKAWINGSENEIFRIVNKYFTTLFSDYSRKTMTSYLQEKYNTTNPDQLTQLIRNDIMNTLDGKATPLFWTSNVYNVSNASKIGYVTYPSVAGEVGQAANQLAASKDAGELTVRNSFITDRISIMRCLVGVPLYGYQGINQYENASVKSTAVGKHIYEGKNYTNDAGEYVVGRDWRYLPSPIPHSLMNAQTCDILKNAADEAEKVYADAESKNVIAKTDENNFGIWTIADSFMDQVRKVAADAEGKNKAEKLEAQNKVKEMAENIVYEPDKIKIPNDGAVDLPDLNKRIIRIDHFASAPRLVDEVRAELTKQNEITQIIESLEPKDDSDLTGFFNALFTGMITFKAPGMKCEDDFGAEYILSKPSMMRGGVPLYQGFLSYKELAPDVRTFLAEGAAARLEDLPDEAIDNCQAVSAELKDKKFMVQEANEVFPAEVADLKNFLTEIEDNLKRFARRYRFSLD